MPKESTSFIATLHKFDSPLWGYHIVVPDEIAETFLSNYSQRIICTLFGETEFHCALMATGKALESVPPGKYFINVNKELRHKFNLEVGEEVKANIRPDKSRYGLPMPDEMAELLAQDPEGNHYFHALSPGKQRSLLFIVGKPKRGETRLKKAVVVLEHLNGNKGKLDFRRLQEYFKEANRH